MTNPVVTNVVSQLLKKEPVLALSLTVWILTNLGAVLVGHAHLVAAGTWSGVATAVTPVLSGLILGGLAWLTRKFVTPLVKKL